jgi:hypothetical protein
MKTADLSQLQDELERRVRARIGNRLRNLSIVLSPDGVVLTGQAPTYYIKQLAQHSVWEVLPEARLRNAIVVP